MCQVLTRELTEAEKLLEKVQSWSEEEVERLPELYRKKAREYQSLENLGDQ